LTVQHYACNTITILHINLEPLPENQTDVKREKGTDANRVRTIGGDYKCGPAGLGPGDTPKSPQKKRPPREN